MIQKLGMISILVITSAFLPISLFAGVKGLPEGESRVKVGEKAPLETTELKKAHEEGKAILLMFGNPWHCIACEKMWFVKEIMPKYEKEFAFIQLAAQRVKFWDPPEANVKLARRYGIQGEPWMFVIDKKGIVQHIFIGFTKVERIEEEMKKLLEKQTLDIGHRTSGQRQ